MEPIKTHERKVANIRDEAAYQPYDPTGKSETGTSFMQLNPHARRDVGFYIYRMEPGSHSMPHKHGGAEEFLMVEGELIDNDGTVYKPGDVIWLASGTEHTSHTETGCIVAVYAEAAEEPPSSPL
ncbi:cupin domain-containing protein [uncultured Roseovarius sp.]|uniref:cupin domain-containing protein n=1 Tax=uncultured Roseovarius sp. TaxID=293344 RepID=UPI00260CE477|nr:cupin domain-containing protein [uncultured Roseovarius sp.]